jgi:hypothetical protein
VSNACGAEEGRTYPIDRPSPFPGAGSRKCGESVDEATARARPVEDAMDWHPLVLMRIVFVVLVCVVVAAGVMTKARPRTGREWVLVWVLFVVLAWALLGFVFLRSA